MPTFTPVLVVKAPGRLCEGLRSLLENQPSVRLIGVVQDKEAFFQKIKYITPPCILIMDYDLFGDSIFETCQTIKNAYPETGCILLVDTSDEKSRGFSAGANEVLIKGYSVNDLLASIQRVRFIHYSDFAQNNSGVKI